MPRRVQPFFVVVRVIVGLMLMIAALTTLLPLVAVLTWLLGAA
jgi:hypothetical protein